MNKQDYQERIRKIRWATERKTGKRMGKKDLLVAQQMVLSTLPQKCGENTQEEKSQDPSLISSLLNLNNLVGKDLNVKPKR